MQCGHSTGTAFIHTHMYLEHCMTELQLNVCLYGTYSSYYDYKDGKDKTSLLRRLQVQTLPNDAPLVGKIHPFRKIAVTFEPI